MFERNRVNNAQYTPELMGAAVQVDLTDGRCLSGCFLISRPKSLIEVLNGPSQFLEFEPYDGDPEVIAKASIRSLRPIARDTTRRPSLAVAVAGGFDPHQILGIEKSASRVEVRDAFHRLAKIYHPDRYSNTDLPTEVAEYLQTMARRINAAYEVLTEEVTRADGFARQRTDPVYRSGTAA